MAKKRQFGLKTHWFQVFSSTWLGTCNEPHSKDLSIGKAVTIFGFHKSMMREARRGERGLSCGSLHWHQVWSEPGHPVMSPESWMPQDWQWPLNRAPPHSHCQQMGELTEDKKEQQGQSKCEGN